MGKKQHANKITPYRDGDRGSNGIFTNQGTANIPNSHQMLGDMKQILPPIVQEKWTPTLWENT